MVQKLEVGMEISKHELFLLSQNNQLLIEHKNASDRRIAELERRIAVFEASDAAQKREIETLRASLAEEKETGYRLQDRIDSTWGIWRDAARGRYIRDS
jgi:uncharacterized coiled-coil protein SlyX